MSSARSLLQTLDHLWREHLVNLDHLRSVVGFRGYAQRDPLNEYKSESFELFQALLGNLRQAVTGAADARRSWCARPPTRRRRKRRRPSAMHIDATTGEDDFSEGSSATAAS